MDQTDQVQHFLDYWQVVRSRKEVVIAVSLFIIVTSILITLSLPKVYLASARIAVRREGPDVPFQQQAQISPLGYYDPYFLRTQFEIIQSRPILYEVIRNLGLQQHFGKAYDADGAPLSLQKTYKLLSRSMKVQQYRDTNLIEIQMYRSKPKETAREDAARIANEIASVYRDQRMAISRGETERGVQALMDAHAKQQKKVEEAEAHLEDIRKTLGITVIATAENWVHQLDKSKLPTLETDRVAARNNMLSKKMRMETINRLQGDELLYAAACVIGDRGLATLREQLIEAEALLISASKNYGAKHPEVTRLQAVVDDIRKKVGDVLKGLKMGLQTDYDIAQKEFEAIDNEVEEAKQTDREAEEAKYLPFNRAERELARQRQIRDALEIRLVEERIELDLPRTPVELVEPAEPPDENNPVSPNLPLNIVLGVIVGLAAGIGLAFFLEYLDTSVKTVEDIEQNIGAPILGVIPQKVRPLIEEGPDSPYAESYRILRTNIQLSKKMKSRKTICFTSGGAGEGKSLTLFNLAYISAKLGDKVLIVDSDMRRPTQHRMVGVPNKPGLTDVLMQTASVDEVIRQTQVPNLFFLASGKPTTSSLGLLDSQRMRDLLSQLKDQFDLILFDTPPIMGVSDASVIASEVDGVLLVVQHRYYPRIVSSRAKTIIENVGGNLVGVVLNNINLTRDYYYYYHSYYTRPQTRQWDEESASPGRKKEAF